jgi:hypothetical protein
MGAAYLCAEAGISNAVSANQAAYVAGWLRKLRDDRKLLTYAAAQAGKLGVGMLIIPAKSWKHMDADFNAFRYGGMPADEGEQNIGLFDETVMPMVKIWEPDPFTKLTPLNPHAESLKERKSA